MFFPGVGIKVYCLTVYKGHASSLFEYFVIHSYLSCYGLLSSLYACLLRTYHNLFMHSDVTFLITECNNDRQDNSNKYKHYHSKLHMNIHSNFENLERQKLRHREMTGLSIQDLLASFWCLYQILIRLRHFQIFMDLLQ